jgi:hypothetical protein
MSMGRSNLLVLDRKAPLQCSISPTCGKSYDTSIFMSSHALMIYKMNGDKVKSAWMRDSEGD